jgi:hypothetical protein
VVTVLPLVLGPLLVGASTLAARRWSDAAGGIVSAFPAIVGPLLLLGAIEHGAGFAARTAAGALFGLAALSAFVAAYGRTAPRAGWPASLAAGWLAAAALALTVGTVGGGLLAGLAVAAASLLGARALLPRTSASAPPLPSPRWDLPARMGLTGVLIAALAAAGDAFGPVVGGVLTALPVLASVLAVFTHEQRGAPALVALLRGMVGGMAGYVAFCAAAGALV